MQITDRDRELLEFVAEHRLVLADHVRALIRTSPAASQQRLGTLSKAGLLSHRRVFHNEPGCYQITRFGLSAIDSKLPQPRIDLRCYRHDVGVAWLWLAARAGAFGALSDLTSERRMRSCDAAADASGDRLAEPLGVRMGGVGPHGAERRHYPDLLLTGARGHRIALELELSSKGRVRRERILAGYGADPRIDAVLYLTNDRSIGRAISSAATRLGVGWLVSVQDVRGACLIAPRTQPRVAERAAGRSASR